MVSERSFLSLHSQNDQISRTQNVFQVAQLLCFFIATKIAPRGERGGATFTSESLCTKLARRLGHKIRVVVWLVQEVFRLFFFFFKEANTDSTMLKSRQLAVDFCPQASQSDGAHGDDTTTQILTLCERCK